ncbi:HD family phosphohydrolase [Paenibacillus xerothermodurans]|uniref:HDIG domain-containing protein n=1 Tax=Paenibacillus xerothermodurans TaxID=1977292 RepID=A0A2W1NY93_PAEXE|nr:HDIG domain-containing metalloprotein [Paenibacillus xerothermodurans]PZE22696.1 HDIG domain-containing protein [Paenibacillus xerothermodurans]
MKNQISVQNQLQSQLAGWKYSALVRFLLFFVLTSVFYVALTGKVIPQTYDIQIGGVAEKDILAPRAIENAVATEQAKEEAAQRVQPVYQIVPLKNDLLVESIFQKLQQINGDAEVTLGDKVNIFKKVIPEQTQQHAQQLVQTYRDSGQYSTALLEETQQQVNQQQYRIPEETYYKMPRLSKEDLTEMEPVAVEIVNRLMNEQIMDAQTARAKVAELVNSSTLTKSAAREIVQELVRAAITPNKFLDQKATEEAKGHARDDVKPVLVNKNDVLVKEGEPITEDIYERLRSLEMLQDETSLLPRLGLLMLVAMFSLLVYMFVRHRENAMALNNSNLLMLALILIITILGMQLFSLLQNLDYPYIGLLAPTAMGAMLIAILLNSQIAFIAAVLIAVLASVIFNTDHLQLFDFRYGIFTLAISFAAIFSIQRASQRSSILKAGMMVSLAGMVIAAALLLIEDHESSRNLVFALCFTVGGGLLTAVFVIGLLPFFEVAFGILSPLKLVELSNPNHPLLRKLLTETPGTYHHSIMVGNLAEAAAEAIGANGLLCRVGAYYHDIGKTKRPVYFIENQNNMENPHDRMDPELSKSIIIAHARDGVEMLKEYNIPKPIRDIAEQHHGTTLLQYFYHKAVKNADADGQDKVEEADFRYPGPIAQSKEAAVVGIADCVEAAVRSLRSPTLEQIDSMVRKIIKGRLDDGQFNECDLTVKELDQIAKTLKESLLGIFHSRIEYPTDLPGQSPAAVTKPETKELMR